MTAEEKLNYQTTLFENRLTKRFKHLKKWAKRSNVFCYRLYDKDIPEIPLVVDVYEHSETEECFLQIALYERPYEKSEEEESQWLESMKFAAARSLLINPDNIIFKVRRKQKGENQYEKNNDTSLTFTVKEQGQIFKVNLSSYLDTGLFFDHRPLRQMIRSSCQQKDVLNLFCYTGSFSVYAAQGKAKSVDSVDLSKTYLAWAEENFKLNGFDLKNNQEKYRFINKDVFTFLQESIDSKEKLYDIIVLDPPTFSNSKKTENLLDINKDWPKFVSLCLKLLKPYGVLYFSTNSRRLNFSAEELYTVYENSVSIVDITDKTIPEDFRNKKIHRCWEIKNNVQHY